MKIVDLAQRTPDWHTWRNSGISASEADVVLGRSPYKTKYRLWAEKKGLILPVNLDRNPHVRRGIRLEPVARSAFEDRHNTLLLSVCAESDAYPFIRASFDGIDDQGVPVEIKAPTEKNYRDSQMADDSDEAFFTEEDFRDIHQNRTQSKLYQRYYPQVQQQILVAGSSMGWLSLYLNANEYLDIPIPRDDALINELVFDARKFWECLKNNTPPERDPARDIFIPSGLELDRWNQWALQYHQAEALILDYKSKIAALTQEQTVLEEQFINLMGDFAHAESAGLRISRYLQQGSVDYKAVLKSLHPDLDPTFLEPFRKSSTERSRFTLKDEDSASVPYSMDEIVSSNNDDFWF